jgi:ATPase subunit of ABC transporter with duplicated ATPase domains
VARSAAQEYPHTALIISHDRELLNNSVDAILHLSAAKLELYTGGYDDFETRRAEKSRLQAATKAKQDAERAHLQRFIDRFRAKASKATQAQSRIKRLAKLEPIAAVVEERVAAFTLPSPTRPLAPPLIQLEGAAVGYDGASVLRNPQSAARRRRPHRAPWRQRGRQIDVRQNGGRRPAACWLPDESVSNASASAGFIHIRSKRLIRRYPAGHSAARTAG